MKQVYRIAAVAGIVLIMVILGVALLFASEGDLGERYDNNIDGFIDGQETLQAIYDYFDGEINRDEVNDLLLLYVGTVPVARLDSMPSPTPLSPTPTPLSPTPTPLSPTPTPLSPTPTPLSPTPTPTPVPTPTPTPTPIPTVQSPHDKLRCSHRGNGTVQGKYSLKQGVATHMEATFVNPSEDYWEYGFRVHNGETHGSIYPEAVGPSGFILVVSSEGEVVLKEISGKAVVRIPYTNYLSDLGIPFNTDPGQRNHLTLLSKNENELHFRFFVNGVGVDGIESVDGAAGAGYTDLEHSRTYARHSKYWEHFLLAEPQTEVEGACINNAWVRLD